MSGTVLSTLCSICHTEPPKYKCPRCGVRTCSVPCVQKHKARADCDGVRNPRAFMPLKQLKTPAGVDHDYNFLTSIERARERAEKEVLEARRLLSEKDLRPKNEDKVFQKVWYGDELRHVPVQSQPYGKPEGPAFIDGFDKHVRRRLRYLNIDAITMPKGMARQRENKTAWNRRTQSINWQVEWLVYSASDLGFTSALHDQQQPLRILCKTLEGTALHSGLASALDWHRGQLDRRSREQPDPTETDNEAESDDGPPAAKKRKTHHHNKNQFPTVCPIQDPSTSTWSSAPYSLQYQPTTAWSQTITLPHAETTLEEKLMSWDFYLVNVVPPPLAAFATATNDGKNQTKKGGSKTIIPLSSTESLTAALSGRRVLEFPTVVAVPGGWGPPAGYTVELDERPDRIRGAAGRAARAHRRGANADMSADTGNTGDAGETLPRPGPAKRPRRQGADGAGGRGGKRFRSSPSPSRTAALPREELVGQHQQQSDDEGDAEEGEVNSDGDEVMGEAADADGYVEEADDSDSEDGSSSTTMGREDEAGQPQQQEENRPEAGRPRGGLVDYGSSDESD
ncbi:hypothetical protein MYCTH_2311603 [Thermothelomyces thermophilus ATCC 42464]|uniref:Box C/D snoRNA protein 1 n=1 Tax=Thermothelomyces thermophilus (strain ATCC 42464 / BCRC 31852 / DSM 1799) TaxID=573729 RepID=G2QPD2_THET4|nr:uncharacterized protein MYCTH_2311603 [Thermothelomyces thermophilus ATCC 42464]AEO61445.1 hypothetical protein MYCTH_2311603 [Thermothelomyces thermophilus ATCC 42464]